MSVDRVATGRAVPDDVNVVVEIPMNGPPVKYELDKSTGAMMVDRFMSTAMYYPCNYGYIPQTLSGDGDPVDMLVIAPVPLLTGVVVRCRPIGILKMTDEAGEDEKLLGVPVSKLSKIYDQVKSYQDLEAGRTAMIEHFFTHYKDLEPGKWVKIAGWGDAEEARQAILDGVNRFKRDKAA
jgi:inorganic pyrophosphatase